MRNRGVPIDGSKAEEEDPFARNIMAEITIHFRVTAVEPLRCKSLPNNIKLSTKRPILPTGRDEWAPPR